MTIAANRIDLSLAPETSWREAERRAALIRPLAGMTRCPNDRVAAVAGDLGLSTRQVHRLIRRCRAADGALTALLPTPPDGGRGKARLSAESEAVMTRVIEETYLTRQRVRAETLVRDVRRACAQEGVKAPAPSTIRRRLAALSLKDQRKRDEPGPVRPIIGATPEARFPLDLMQMDHTRVDLILVDAVERKPIGRPWITVAIDVFSRAIAGFHLSLEAPSSVSVGLCLTRVATDKAVWLSSLDVEADWPVTGKPGTISVDNAREFHSEAFKRGCAQHGITIDWRPRGQPHFGGVVERVIGTLMGLIHEAPGTTFSNPVERGKRSAFSEKWPPVFTPECAQGRKSSDKTACLTLDELERWLTVAIAKVYHLRPHEGIGCETPLARWRAGVEAFGRDGRELAAVADPRLFTIDFLPMAHRTLRRDGVVMDRITYFSEALKPWIAAGSPRRLLIRRDPRDISRVFILDEIDNSYLEVPYRDRSHPPISLWEHRLALRRLRDQRRDAIDESALFAAVAEMRDIEAEAAGATRSARRNQARRAGLRFVVPTVDTSASAAPDQTPEAETPLGEPVTPFDVEPW